VGDQAAVDGDDLVGAVSAQARVAVRVDGELHAGPPAQRVGLNSLDLSGPVDAGKPLELLTYDIAEQRTLRGWLDVLEVATPAGPGAGVWAGWFNSTWRRLEDLDRIGPQERLRIVGDADPHALPRQGMAYEHDLAVDSRDTVTTVRDGTDVDDDVIHD
jgi:hypothetical protein